MPIYEYRCDNGHIIEVMQSMRDDALTECTECGAPTRRVLHSPAIHFKGSGFHNTDYGTRKANKAKQAAAAASDSGSGSGSGGDSGSGSDSSGSSSDSGGSGDSKKSEPAAKSSGSSSSSD